MRRKTPGKALRIKLRKNERSTLKGILKSRTTPAVEAMRARIVLLSAEGLGGREIALRVGCTASTVSRARDRFLSQRVEGVADRQKTGRKDHALPAETKERIVKLALSPPPAGRSRWTGRLLARAVGVSLASVARVLRERSLKPHLVRTYKVSHDPKFVEKVEDVVGLYLNPPENAIVLSLDEKTSIQALERTQLPLPVRTGRAARHTHDYKRHGVIDLYAALNPATGKVIHRCTETHTAADFIAFMNLVVRKFPKKELHVILDNSSSHNTEKVRAWLEGHPLVHFHFTPTSASWLNQIEGFFGVLGKQSLSMVDFPSKKALRQHIEAYMAKWNDNPTPFCWTKPAKAIIDSHARNLARMSDSVH
jgi:transposase